MRWVAALCGATAAALAAAAADVRPPTAPPNVIVIVVDTLRADRLGAYGDPQGLTPFLDRLARRGTVFANAYAASSWTCPSIASLFTSRSVSHHGVVSFQSRLADDEITFAEQLAAAGYVGGGFSANLRLTMENGFAQGFAHWRVFTADPEIDAKPRGRELRYDALGWVSRTLAAEPTHPLLLYLQYMEPHSPYRPTSVYRRRVGLPAVAAERETVANQKVVAVGAGRKGLLADEVELLQRLYDGEVAAVDDEIAALMGQLESAGALRNAVIVITADHGEEFGEHGEFLHGVTLYEPSIRVPLIVAGTGIAAGRTVTENVSLLDVAPTVVALAGLTPSPRFEGRSLVPLLRPAAPSVPSGAAPPRSGAVATELAPTGGALDVRRHARALVDGTDKLVVAKGGDQELYDLSADPGETTPRSAIASARAAVLADRLAAMIGAPPQAASAAAIPLDQATKERLRALGYHP
jgi:arylsulfatase A-like enzyme